MSQEYFFYDYECFGLNHSHDRIAQFAGVRTDADFKPIGEPIELYCQPSDDYLPGPGAVMITGITPQKCLQKGLPEPEFAQRVREAFGKNTCILGFNNLRYDDEFTRFLFYRNFIPPYQWQYENGNSRWDLIDLVRACYALRPEGINWPEDENGVVRLKLENLTKANNITHENPHDALSDVYSTIAIAKLIREKQPQLFEYYFNCRDKNFVCEKINLANPEILVHISGKFKNEEYCTQLVLPIAFHPKYENRLIVAKLNEQIDDLISLSPEELHKRLYLKEEEELRNLGVNRPPLKEVHLNKCPFLTQTKLLRDEDKIRLNLDLSEYENKANKWRQNLDKLIPKIKEIYNQPYNKQVESDVETRLYGKFFTPKDESKFAEIYREEPAVWSKIKFEDERLNELLFRYRARHFNNSLTPAEQAIWQEYRRTKLQQHEPDFYEKLKKVEADLPTATPNSALQELRAYVDKLLAQI